MRSRCSSLLVILVGLLVVADRVGRGVAERRIADQVAQRGAKQQSTRPDVTVGGFPFLTQVLDGSTSRSDRANDCRTGTAGARRTSTMDARRGEDVRRRWTPSRRQGDVVAGPVNGTGTISYDSLAALLDQRGPQLGEQDGKLAG